MIAHLGKKDKRKRVCICVCSYRRECIYNTRSYLFSSSLPRSEAKQCRFPVLVCRRRLRRLGREEDEEGEGENVGYTYVLKFYLHESL